MDAKIVLAKLVQEEPNGMFLPSNGTNLATSGTRAPEAAHSSHPALVIDVSARPSPPPPLFFYTDLDHDISASRSEDVQELFPVNEHPVEVVDGLKPIPQDRQDYVGTLTPFPRLVPTSRGYWTLPGPLVHRVHQAEVSLVEVEEGEEDFDHDDWIA